MTGERKAGGETGEDTDGDTGRERFDAFVDAFPDIGFILDGRGIIEDVYAGPKTVSLLFDDPEEIIGESLLEVLPTEKAARMVEVVKDVLDTQELHHHEYTLHSESGTRWFQARIAPITDADSVVWLARDITGLKTYEKELSDKNRILATIQQVTQAISHARSQDSLEQEVCDILADSEPYLFAWVGEYDPVAQTIEPTASAGVEHGYLDDVAVDVDPEANGHRLTVRAIEREAIQVMQNIMADQKYEAWHEEAAKRGYRSSAAVPLLFEDTLYGVLSVYADRPFAFDEDEKLLIEEVGRDMAHAEQAIQDRETIEQNRQTLEQTNTQWEILNRVVRHDIRNDMQIVLAWLEHASLDLDDETVAALEKAIDASEHVVELTEIARDFSETLAADGNPELEPTDLRRLIRTEVEKLEETNDEVTVTVADTPDVSVQANQMLSSVVRNLLTNAVIHNDSDQPRIDIRVTVDEETATLRVADNGPGVPDDQKRTIFGKDEHGLDSPGTGIGLYLADSLVTSYGGRIWVEDGPITDGSDTTGAQFHVELPTATVDSAFGA